MNLQNNKAFSLIEVIFAIAIISIIAMVAIPKLGSSLDKANIIKIKSDIMLIRNGLVEYKNKMTLSQQTDILNSLENSSDILFDKILTNPIIASAESKSTAWSKVSDTTYKVWLTTEENLIFTYNSDEYSFDCDNTISYCQELTQ